MYISQIQRLEDISPDEAKRLRDDHGNTLLHRCVLLGNADAVKFLLEKNPDSTADMNLDNTTAVELAAKVSDAKFGSQCRTKKIRLNIYNDVIND